MGTATFIRGLTAFVVLACAACQGGAAPRSSDLGGASLDARDVQCKSDADCNAGEACGDGVCQMRRCAEASYTSISPLGTMGYFKRDRELVVVGQGTQLQGYDTEDHAFVRPKDSAWSSTTGNIVDVAGGNLLGTRPEAVVFVTEGSQVLSVQSGQKSTKNIQLTFSPIALAVADVDADETDDIVAVSANGMVAVCSAVSGACETTNGTPPPAAGASPGAIEVLDATAGDVDGDGYAEAILLTNKSFVVVNFDSAKTGNTKVIEYASGKEFKRLAAGDLDGDGADDLVAVYDGYLGDDLHLFSLRGGTVTPKTTLGTSNGTVDVAVGMFGRDRPEIALLRSNDSTEMFALDSSGQLVSEYQGLLSSTQVTRIATADVDGDSPARRVLGAPKLVPGNVVPIAVLTLPPYSRTHSDGRSSVSAGHASATGETKSEGTVFAVQAGLGFSQEFSVFAKAVEVEVEAHYSQETWKTRGVSNSLSKSASFEIEANPEMEGFDSGAVVLGCGCYHEYKYALDDPAHKMGEGADGKEFSLFVPVDAQTSVWSTRRYNALVAALGDKKLPAIKIPYQLGQVSSYPTKPVTLDGELIQQRDMIFTSPPTLRSSDVAATSFELSVEREETNEELVYKGFGGSGTVGVFGVTASGSVDAMSMNGYEVSVSKTSTFSGTIPPLRNDPSTPEDELKLYGYSVTPLLYRHRYVDGAGREGGFLVLTYAVGK